MPTSGLGDKVWGGDNDAQECAALVGLVVHDGLLLHHVYAQAEFGLSPSLAVAVPKHPLHAQTLWVVDNSSCANDPAVSRVHRYKVIGAGPAAHIELSAEAVAVIWAKASGSFDVEVGLKAMHICAYAVACHQIQREYHHSPPMCPQKKGKDMHRLVGRH